MNIYSATDYKNLPVEPGVYRFLNNSNEILYVGKAKNLKNRVSSYFLNKDLGEKTRNLVSQIKKVHITVVESELDALLLEASLIKKYTPKYNIDLKDGKAYPLIRITIKNRYPSVLIARRPDDKNSTYFGPYPHAGAMKMVLKTMRRIFPYQSILSHPKRICLYNHLNLCPCPPMFGSNEQRAQYKKTILHIIKFLDGKSKQVLKDLKKEMKSSIKTENFEQAGSVKKQIDAINYVLSPSIKPFEYEVNPNLRTDLRQKELDSLKSELNKLGLQVQMIRKIECYDISNTSGKNATGSLIVFVDGEADKNQYRRFKIRKDYDGRPNDFAMHQEVLQRRIRHKEWQFPDLIIVDGGKGQVSAAMEVLAKEKMNIPLIGLAKRLETIIAPSPHALSLEGRGKKGEGGESFKELTLPLDSDASKLIRRIRDEAHRFAITYHRKLRSKSTFA